MNSKSDRMSLFQWWRDSCVMISRLDWGEMIILISVIIFSLLVLAWLTVLVTFTWPYSAYVILGIAAIIGSLLILRRFGRNYRNDSDTHSSYEPR
jgi:hypothetical protein